MNYINEPKINETHQPLNQRKIITIKKSLKLKKEKKRIKKIHKKCQKTKNLRKTEEHIIYKNIINNKANDKDLEVFHLLNQYSNINKCKNNLNDKNEGKEKKIFSKIKKIDFYSFKEKRKKSY